MRTKVLLTIKIYYVTFILATLYLTLATGYTSFEFLSQAPILFLLHGNINEIVSSLLKYYSCLLAIFYVLWLTIYEDIKYHLIYLKIYIYAINAQKLLSTFIGSIFYPPKHLIT